MKTNSRGLVTACRRFTLQKSTRRIINRQVFLVCYLVIAAALLARFGATAHTIDYVAMNISPSSMFNGVSNNFTVTDPVAPGSQITFQLTYEIKEQGSTTSFPRTVTFGASTDTKPSADDPDAVVTGLGTHTFESSASTFSDQVAIIAPSIAGAYTVKILPTEGIGGKDGLSSGGGIAINFTVASLCAVANTQLALTLENSCIVYHASVTSFSATLTSGGSPVPGKMIDFNVGGLAVGSATTDSSGVATLPYNPNGLPVGDHSVTASFQGDECHFNGSSSSATLGVKYMFLGFQPPINPDGTSSFNGRSITVKVRIRDANGAAVPDAEAYVYFAAGTPEDGGVEMLANSHGDTGNAMRYDPVDDQYVFNWDVGELANGVYTIRVGLGEGSCADDHTVVVTLSKKSVK